MVNEKVYGVVYDTLSFHAIWHTLVNVNNHANKYVTFLSVVQMISDVVLVFGTRTVFSCTIE